MRSLVDWYFTAYPPIMHDLHESLPLLYTYSGGAPQNPNLDPILFTELPFFSNFELQQMTKYGMPGVYTHAFMDGWSPGYLGSVAYNHNGMMRMYETQSGRESGPAAARRRRRATAPATTAPATTAPPTTRAGARAADRARHASGHGPSGGRCRRSGTSWPRGRGGRGGGDAAPRVQRPLKVRRRRRRPCQPGGLVVRPAEDASQSRPDAAAASRASGTAGCRFRRTPSRISHDGTTRTTCRRASSRACNSPPCSRTWWSTTSTGRHRSRSRPARTRRRTATSSRRARRT